MTDPEVRLGEIRAYLPAAKAGRAANPERYPADFDWAIGIVEELLLGVDRLQANNRMWMQQVNQLKDRLREIQWVIPEGHIVGVCPACGKPQTGTTLLEVVDGRTVTRPAPGHDPECWLWLAIRTV